MSKSKVIVKSYDGIEIQFSGDGWFNATEAARKFGKKPNDWLRLPETESYLMEVPGRQVGMEADISRVLRNA